MSQGLPRAGAPRARGLSLVELMADKEQSMVEPLVSSAEDRERAIKILARSIYREMTLQGYQERQVVALSTELLDLVASALNGRRGQ